MVTEPNLEKVINDAMVALKCSADFSDASTTASFMLLQDAITRNPKAVLTSSNLCYLALESSCIITSSFIRKYPKYKDISNGMFFCSIGFFSYMRQLEKGDMLNMHYPAFISLLHYGRNYMEDVFVSALYPELKHASLYNVMDQMKLSEAENKKSAMVKAFECLIIRTCHSSGYADEGIIDMGIELEREFQTNINIGGEPFDNALKVYRFIEAKLATDNPFDFCIK